MGPGSEDSNSLRGAESSSSSSASSSTTRGSRSSASPKALVSLQVRYYIGEKENELLRVGLTP